ncbi:DUF5677 domain-containing protein [Haladaptatus caseinilyticus]|uniref:DUF5677 domain-containing protein n=1 Tax=Haladaptatus caseinilyticus TaxID=2993314 RepID=UPI00224AC312|nr:DUF5677 domain-containing protein [Haladaptatus caseinilyticus]
MSEKETEIDDWYITATKGVMERVVKEVESYDGEIDDEAEEEILDIGVDVLLDELARKYDKAIKEEKSNRDQMEESIRGTWEHALDFLDFFILVNQKSRRLIEQVSGVDEKDEDYQFDALMRLHVRALRVSREVAALLRAGFADGAMARWRTLHEIAAVATIIAEEGEVAGERYLKFKTAKDLFRVKNNYDDYFEKLGFDEIPEEDVEELEAQTEELIDKFGEDFDNFNGWATAFVEGGGGVTITDLIEEAELEEYLPFYALACDSIHAGSKGTLFQMGLHEAEMGGEEEVLLAGRSDIGFTDPAQLTAIMLRETTEALRALVPDENWQAHWEMYFRAMDVLVDEIADAFWHVDQLLSGMRGAGVRPDVA